MVDIRESARRWARTWADAWPTRDVDAIVALQGEHGDHWASMFRPYRGRSGLRTYLEDAFAAESRPAQVWFAEPRVDGDVATVEYWAVTSVEDQPVTISGCTVLRFDEAGLVADARDYSHAKEGHHVPPAGLFD
ncbi:nuclear transport factor 2 family protein [Micromonospora sp. LH3U1]|uniref:nuclear transport factor 2 family protein n=1 Tax=Micromonospora sp. LH3U1 TaxID=3018339 RepID=UPI00234AF152|nr:nuclear transport factor 2 family protein [Micromonospora sp. LH3U1]WCN82647.1 nuclear transport factor 2 family protein [Micromonospora sp. LH3U1]